MGNGPSDLNDILLQHQNPGLAKLRVQEAQPSQVQAHLCFLGSVPDQVAVQQTV